MCSTVHALHVILVIMPASSATSMLVGMQAKKLSTASLSTPGTTPTQPPHSVPMAPERFTQRSREQPERASHPCWSVALEKEKNPGPFIAIPVSSCMGKWLSLEVHALSSVRGSCTPRHHQHHHQKLSALGKIDYDIQVRSPDWYGMWAKQYNTQQREQRWRK